MLPKTMVQSAHGMATSAAVAAARLGGKTSLIARIGDDMMGDHFVAEIAAEGVDCSNVRRFKDVPTPLSAVIVDSEGERLVLPYYDRSLDNDARWISSAFVVSADAVQVDVRWPEGAQRVLSLARQAGKIAVLDADIGPPEAIIALAELATHSVFSAPASLLVTGCASVEDAVRELSRRFNGFVGVTNGAEGCYWMDRGGMQHLSAPRVKAVDTLAAGDVFHGAFTLAIAEGADIADAVRFANVAAAIKCMTFGGRRGSPTRQEVHTFLAAQANQAG